MEKNEPINQNQLLKVLTKFCSTISELTVSIPHINYEIGNREFSKMIVPENQDNEAVMLTMKNLKKLYLSAADKDLIETFTKCLPTLEDVKICYNNSSLNVIKTLLNNQKNLKKLEIKPHYQKNFNISTDDPESSSSKTEQELFKAILNLTQLTHLNLNRIIVDDQAFQELSENLVHLQSISLVLECENIKNLKSFKNLRKFSFNRNTSETTLQEFCSFDNSKIESLRIEAYPFLEPQTLSAISKSFVNLKTLCINQSLGRNNEVFSFMRSFDRLESFYLTSTLSRMDENFEWLMQNTKVNTNLKNLVIRPSFPNYPSSLKIIKKLVTNFPNLEKVFIRPESIDDEANPLMIIRLLRVMLKGWKNLSHLILHNGGEGLIDDDLELLLDHGHSLKYIEIAEFESEDREEIKKMFQTKCGIMKFGEDHGIILASDHEVLGYREKLNKILSHSLM